MGKVYYSNSKVLMMLTMRVAVAVRVAVRVALLRTMY